MILVKKVKPKVLKPLITIITIIIIITIISPTAASKSQSTGLDLSLAIKENMAAQRSDIEDFIFKTKYNKAEKDERLRLIEERQTRFSHALDEIALDKADLKAARENGTIAQEVFTAGMKNLGFTVALSTKTVKEIDDDIFELKKHIEDRHRPKIAGIEETQNELKKRVEVEEETGDIEEEENETSDSTPTPRISISKEAAIEKAKSQFAPDAVIEEATLKIGEHNTVWELKLSKPDGTEISVLIDGDTGDVLNVDVKNGYSGNESHEAQNETQNRGEKE